MLIDVELMRIVDGPDEAGVEERQQSERYEESDDEEQHGLVDQDIGDVLAHGTTTDTDHCGVAIGVIGRHH